MIAELIEPIVKTLTVGCDATETFRFFTQQIGTWWPVHDAKYSGAGAEDVTLEGREGGRHRCRILRGVKRSTGSQDRE